MSFNAPLCPALIATVKLVDAVQAYDAMEQAGGFPLRCQSLRRIERIIVATMNTRRGVPQLPDRYIYPSKAEAKAQAARLLYAAFLFDHDEDHPWNHVAKTLEKYSQGFVGGAELAVSKEPRAFLAAA